MLWTEVICNFCFWSMAVGRVLFVLNYGGGAGYYLNKSLKCPQLYCVSRAVMSLVTDPQYPTLKILDCLTSFYEYCL